MRAKRRKIEVDSQSTDVVVESKRGAVDFKSTANDLIVQLLSFMSDEDHQSLGECSKRFHQLSKHPKSWPPNRMLTPGHEPSFDKAKKMAVRHFGLHGHLVQTSSTDDTTFLVNTRPDPSVKYDRDDVLDVLLDQSIRSGTLRSISFVSCLTLSEHQLRGMWVWGGMVTELAILNADTMLEPLEKLTESSDRKCLFPNLKRLSLDCHPGLTLRFLRLLIGTDAGTDTKLEHLTLVNAMTEMEVQRGRAAIVAFAAIKKERKELVSLISNQPLTHLTLRPEVWTFLIDSGSFGFEASRTLQELTLLTTAWPSVGLNRMPDCPNLTKLDMKESVPSALVCEQLAKLPNLQEVTIGVPIQIEKLDLIARSKSIIRLSYPSNISFRREGCPSPCPSPLHISLKRSVEEAKRKPNNLIDDSRLLTCTERRELDLIPPSW